MALVEEVKEEPKAPLLFVKSTRDFEDIWTTAILFRVALRGLIKWWWPGNLGRHL